MYFHHFNFLNFFFIFYLKWPFIGSKLVKKKKKEPTNGNKRIIKIDIYNN